MPLLFHKTSGVKKNMLKYRVIQERKRAPHAHMTDIRTLLYRPRSCKNQLLDLNFISTVFKTL